MIAFYEEHEGGLRCSHLVMTYDPAVLDHAHAGDEPFVHLAEPVTFEHLRLDRCPDTGAVRAWCHEPDCDRRQLQCAKPLLRHELTVDPEGPHGVGAEVAVRGIPAGARITINGGLDPDVMDESGVYEVTLADAGRYRLCIEADGYAAAEIILDAA